MSLLAIGTLTTLDTNGNSPIVSAAERTVAVNSIDNVALAAVAVNGLNGLNWAENLTQAVDQSGSNGSTTVSGTTITWTDGTACYQATMPTPDTNPDVTTC